MHIPVCFFIIMLLVASPAFAACRGNLHFGGCFRVMDALRFDAGYSMAVNNNSNNLFTAGLTAEF